MVSREDVRRRMQALREEQERRKRLVILRRDALRRTEYLRTKIVIDPHDVYALVKEFFKEFTGKRYEFTIPELREELRHTYLNHRIRQDVHTLLEALHRLEYANVTFTREQLTTMLDLFRTVVQEAVHAQVRPRSFLARVRDFLWQGEEEPDTVVAELPATEAPDPERIMFAALAERCYAALDRRDRRRARAAYRALLAAYHRLPAEHQRAQYALVDQTYHDLLNRR